MKVKVSFTVEIDEAAWMEAYGVEKSEVRADVNSYVYYGTQSQFDALELLKESEADK